MSSSPNPEGFTDTFTSRYIDTGEVRLHAGIGGEGPPLLLMGAALNEFLAPYREDGGVVR